MNEFKLYDRIVNGDLRPHLKRYNSEQGLQKLEEDFYSVEITVTEPFPENILSFLPKDFLRLKDGDAVEIVVDTDGERPKISITGLPNENEEELINIDIPPPPDAKAELFLRIIEDEYERIMASSFKQFELSENPQEISFYATQNIQIAKKIAHEAFLLGKKLRKEGVDSWSDPNVFVVDTLKKYLIYSITKIQILFHPISNLKTQSEGELEDELFDGYYTKMLTNVRSMSKQLNIRHIEKLHRELGEDATLLQRRDFFLQKLKNQLTQISEHQKKNGYAYVYDHEMKRLYEQELGKILSEHYMGIFVNNPSLIGLLEKYEYALETVTNIKLETDSLEYKALKICGFFEKIQMQIDAWKELINLSYSAPIKENILLDLQSIMITIQSRKHLSLIEDQWNDYICDLLRAQKYYVADQSRNGQSGGDSKKKQSGELDITIRDPQKSGIIKTIIETVQINSCGDNEIIIKSHINKLLTRYDTAGNEDSYLIVLSRAKNFTQIWETYKSYVNRVVFRNDSNIVEMKSEPSKADLKLGVTELTRSGRPTYLYHLFVNMYNLQMNEH